MNSGSRASSRKYVDASPIQHQIGTLTHHRACLRKGKEAPMEEASLKRRKKKSANSLGKLVNSLKEPPNSLAKSADSPKEPPNSSEEWGGSFGELVNSPEELTNSPEELGGSLGKSGNSSVDSGKKAGAFEAPQRPCCPMSLYQDRHMEAGVNCARAARCYN